MTSVVYEDAADKGVTRSLGPPLSVHVPPLLLLFLALPARFCITYC